MYRVALRHPYLVGSLAATAAAGTTAVVAVSRAEAQFAESMAWPVSNSNNSSVLIPSAQATVRSLRLIQTAVLMAADYKLDEWGLSTLTSSSSTPFVQHFMPEERPLQKAVTAALNSS